MPTDSKIKLHQFLVDKEVYSKSYEDFDVQFSTPEKQAKLHQFMLKNKLYTKDSTAFQSQFFNGVAKKKADTTTGGKRELSDPLSEPVGPPEEGPIATGEVMAAQEQQIQPEQQETPLKEEFLQRVKEPSQQGRMSSFLGSINQRFYGLPGEALKAIAIGGSKIGRLIEGEELDARENPFYKVGQWYQNHIKEIAPRNKEYQEELQESIGQAIGDLAGLVAGGAIARTATTGSQMAVLANNAGIPVAEAAKMVAKGMISPEGIIGATQMGVSEYEQAKEGGASDEDAFDLFVKNAAVGSVLERMPVQLFWRRLDTATGGGMKMLLKKGFSGGMEEGITEVMQQAYSNKQAQQVYDETRTIIDGMGEAGGIGFGLGFVLNAMGVRLRGLKSEATSKEDIAKIQEAIDIVTEKQNEVNKEADKITEVQEDAIKEGEIKEGDIIERPETPEGGLPPETGGGDITQQVEEVTEKEVILKDGSGNEVTEEKLRDQAFLSVRGNIVANKHLTEKEKIKASKLLKAMHNGGFSLEETIKKAEEIFEIKVSPDLQFGVPYLIHEKQGKVTEEEIIEPEAEVVPEEIPATEEEAEVFGIINGKINSSLFKPDNFYSESNNGIKIAVANRVDIVNSINRLSKLSKVLKNDVISNTVEYLQKGLEFYDHILSTKNLSKEQRDIETRKALDDFKKWEPKGYEDLGNLYSKASSIFKKTFSDLSSSLNEEVYEMNALHSLKDSINNIADQIAADYTDIKDVKELQGEVTKLKAISEPTTRKIRAVDTESDKLFKRAQEIQRQATEIKEKWHTKQGKFKKNTPKSVLVEAEKISDEFNEIQEKYEKSISKEGKRGPYAQRVMDLGEQERALIENPTQEGYDAFISSETDFFLEGHLGTPESSANQVRFENRLFEINEKVEGDITKVDPEEYVEAQYQKLLKKKPKPKKVVPKAKDAHLDIELLDKIPEQASTDVDFADLYEEGIITEQEYNTLKESDRTYSSKEVISRVEQETKKGINFTKATIIENALKKGLYEQAIKDKKISKSEVVKILESVGRKESDLKLPEKAKQEIEGKLKEEREEAVGKVVVESQDYIPIKNLKGKEVKMKVEVEETGKTETITMSAIEVQTDIKKRHKILEKLTDCVG